jgi:hypothetical protein
LKAFFDNVNVFKVLMYLKKNGLPPAWENRLKWMSIAPCISFKEIPEDPDEPDSSLRPLRLSDSFRAEDTSV